MYDKNDDSLHKLSIKIMRNKHDKNLTRNALFEKHACKML